MSAAKRCGRVGQHVGKPSNRKCFASAICPMTRFAASESEIGPQMVDPVQPLAVLKESALHVWEASLIKKR